MVLYWVTVYVFYASNAFTALHVFKNNNITIFKFLVFLMLFTVLKVSHYHVSNALMLSLLLLLNFLGFSACGQRRRQRTRFFFPV